MNWSEYPEEMLRGQARSQVFRDGLDPEQQAKYDEAVLAFRENETKTTYAISDDGKNLLVNSERVLGFSQKLISLLEVRVRRAWAAAIRREFGKYHDHSDGGECGACGAIQAADFMDPDVVGG